MFVAQEAPAQDITPLSPPQPNVPSEAGLHSGKTWAVELEARALPESSIHASGLEQKAASDPELWSRVQFCSSHLQPFSSALAFSAWLVTVNKSGLAANP